MKHIKNVSVKKAVTTGDFRVGLQKAIDDTFDYLNNVKDSIGIPR